jgi:hypothetical protein
VIKEVLQNCVERDYSLNQVEALGKTSVSAFSHTIPENISKRNK